MKEFNNYRNNAKAIPLGDLGWQSAEDSGLLNLICKPASHDRIEDQFGHNFVNLGCSSYLGLNTDSRIIEGAVEGVRRAGQMVLSTSRLRTYSQILAETEETLSELYGAPILTNVACDITSSGILPLISSGHITDTEKVITVFDKNAHFSINFAKPICADEAPVITCPHNDLDYLEAICKKHQRVAYICDGIYSLGDKAPVRELLLLQEKYGLFLYIDDTHGLSIYGQSGEGYAKSIIGELNPITMIVSSLGKAFGACGTRLMYGAKHKTNLIKRHGGAIAWSQPLSSANCGAIIASAKIHKTDELQQLQTQLQTKIKLFDSLVPNPQSGSDFPIRLIHIGDAKTIADIAKAIYKEGFYASPVSFPVLKQGKAALRIMMRSNLRDEEIIKFCQLLKNFM
ncbi:8-amino-7-oxononanoate synthase family protein [Coxiella burnetii]|uniref:8-amino-7-oxononanoate synthase family protein n=1 Tax=Coxiella burnetii TaxID=777 RepID=UPI001EDCB65B|nr:aminotransferase class I/II-fold pyridoxal phosphate-dependent enzyme [Coxiella burnetii]